MTHLLEIKNLETKFVFKHARINAVNSISYTLDAGESMAIVGESGSGKSVSVLSIMQLITSTSGRIVGGEILFKGRDLLTLVPAEIRQVRGTGIAAIFQDPMSSLNPVLTIERQLTESLELHMGLTHRQACVRAVELLQMVGIPNAENRTKDYPHQFSGGQRQRISIAIALSCDPALLIADEPTTALDVTVQAEILDLVKAQVKQRGMGLIWISHDLGVVAGLVDKVAVMYAGYLVELAKVGDLYKTPSHPYTKALLNALPRLSDTKHRKLKVIDGMLPDATIELQCCPFVSRCDFAIDRCRSANPPLSPVVDGHLSACWRAGEIREGLAVSTTTGSEPSPDASRIVSDEEPAMVQVRDLKVHYPGGRGAVIKAVDGVTFDIRKGETLGLVGESGCGKSTTGRAILHLLRPNAGEVRINNENIAALGKGDLRRYRREMQMIFQDPFGSLNPSMTLEGNIMESLVVHNIGERSTRRKLVCELLNRVRLSTRFLNRYPHEVSGGQAQRIGIARALATNPKFIVADEAISALDVSVQAEVVNLLSDIQRDLALTIMFISHDLSMVRYISNRVAVMYLGKIVEFGDCDQVYAKTMHPYTRALFSATPSLDAVGEQKSGRIRLTGELPNPASPPAGCRFHPRCHLATDICRQVEPQVRNLGSIQAPHLTACHHADVTLTTQR